MKTALRVLRWLVNAALFFTLFAFALNNAQEVNVHFFFGHQWQAPMVLVVFSAFTVGVIVGAVGMVPRWWRQRRAAARHRAASAPASAPTPTPPDVERVHDH
ncbi:putative integral membrane protein [Tibeticola sediminis]|jgi:uncharacterized integral membrane protein|uniref:Putative integral membrane protein n=1 Tax=Tibeticola sediminis TaxID=1917811 RepID=A0A3N4VG74_9BURK|nr:MULTISPECIES: LapA family protein [Tibeticola]MCI4440698.1 LapA family protein [Tibeticola sp.]RPE72910.1 putative integral membrane protein [Tibeticola sediminis]